MSWQLAGNPKAPYPKPMPRPGITDRTLHHGRATRPRAEIVAYLRRYAPPKKEVTIDG